MKNKTFSPQKYLSNQINTENCHHELLRINAHDEGLYGDNFTCLICGKHIHYSYCNHPDRSKYIFEDYGIDYEEIDATINFLHYMINYIATYYSDEKKIDIAKIFKEIETYINTTDFSHFLVNDKKEIEKQKIKK